MLEPRSGTGGRADGFGGGGPGALPIAPPVAPIAPPIKFRQVTFDAATSTGPGTGARPSPTPPPSSVQGGDSGSVPLPIDWSRPIASMLPLPSTAVSHPQQREQQGQEQFRQESHPLNRPHQRHPSPSSPAPGPAPAPASVSAPSPATSTSTTSSSSSTGNGHRRQRVLIAAAPMPPASQPGMKNRVSSSTPSLPSASASTPRSSTTATPAAASNNGDGSNNNDNASSSALATPHDSNNNGDSLTSTRHSSASASFVSRPSFLSRLNLPLPLRSRNRHVADFHIQTHEPHRKYCAGEHVRGSVILVAVKPLRITHLTVALNGYVRVVKDPAIGAKVAQSSAAGLLPQGSSERPQYHGSGFATLFQDEQVLSGDGRLDPGKYEFGFDLVFPPKGLPSSIDFERGTISYTVTATLTRPTSIAATTSCDRKVMLVDKVDIGRIPPPRPRTIFLEPMSKRTRRKRSMGLDKISAAAPEVNEGASDAGSADPSVITEDTNRDRPADARYPDQSDIRSEISGESGRSVSTGGLSRAELAQVASAKQQVVDDKTITATVELLRGGCLPGDTVSVRISVQHIKRIKSMTGVIVTLFREGKIDSSPPSSLFTDSMTKEERSRHEKDQAYPRSKIGLAGLSQFSAGSTSVYRKDLDQNTAPLIVNPATLQASVTVSVKLPDDSFPTIKDVPGDMISFKYQVEVIVDLGGKLSSQFKGGQDSRAGQTGANIYDASGNGYSPRRGPSIADTAPLRREKGVVAVRMETIVGTTDSSHGRNRARVSPSLRTLRTGTSDDDEAYHAEYSQPEDSHYGTPYANGQASNGYFGPQHSSQRHYTMPPLHQPPPIPAGSPQQPPYQTNGESSEAPAYIPPPELPDQQNMSEKERVRQAETRLLPSQPPAAGPSSPGEGDMYDADDTPRLPHANPSSPQDEAEEPSAPTQEELSRSSDPPSGEDKQEVERRRLMGEASAPPEFPDDMDRRNSGTSRRDMAPDAEPSAPVLDDDNDLGSQGYGVGVGPSNTRRDHNEQLPAYER